MGWGAGGLAWARVSLGRQGALWELPGAPGPPSLAWRTGWARLALQGWLASRPGLQPQLAGTGLRFRADSTGRLAGARRQSEASPGLWAELGEMNGAVTG